MTHVEPQLRSQRLRMVNQQGDALRLGINWTEEDLTKPQVLVDSAYGMGHPGTFHFRDLVEEVSKSVPAHLLAMARCDLPAFHLSGGTQLNAPDNVTSDQMCPMGADVERGELPRQDLEIAQRGGTMSPTDARTVVITDYDYGDVAIERAIIEGAGLQLTAAHCKTEDEVIEAARDADAIIAQYATVGAKAIAALTRCRVIARYGTGVDIVDVDAATERGILVTNVPSDWCENEVADHAMALLLASARKICAYDRATRGGTWRWQTGHPIHRLRGSWVGLLSFGAIAQAIATRAAGFGMRVIAHDPYVPEADIAARGAVPVSFDQLLEPSDYVVIQAPLTQETHHLIGEAELRRMKPTAFLINTARGPIVNDDALYRGLREGWIAGAGLDDVEEEPAKQRFWKPDNPLFTLPNAVITPHAAYYSEEAIHTVRDFAAHEVVRVLTGKRPVSPLNADEISRLSARPLYGGRS